MRVLIALVCALLLSTSQCLALVVGYTRGVSGGGGGGGGGSCSETAFITQDTHDQAYTLGSTALNAPYYVGILNTGTADLVICSIDIYARENGSLSGKTLSVEVWSTTGTSLLSKVADVTTVDATVFASTIGYYSITFPSVATIAQNQVLVFTLNEATGTTNNLTFAYKGTASTVDDQVFYEWNVSKARNGSANNDIRAIFYGSN
jgi:hypothetical protein